jgi:hypothetical protein
MLLCFYMMTALIAFMVSVSLLRPVPGYPTLVLVQHSPEGEISSSNRRMMILLWSIVACIMISIYFIFS